MTDDLTQRLRRGTAVRLDSERSATNVASLRHAAATHAGPAPSTRGTSVGAAGAGWRRRVAALALAAALVMPGLAVAAESSLPGEALHPVKTSLEGPRSLFDPTVAAEHRLDELAALLASDAGDGELAAALAAAEAAVASLAETDPDRAAPLVARLAALRAEVAARSRAGTSRPEQPDAEEDGVEAGAADRVWPRTPVAPTDDETPDAEDPEDAEDAEDPEDEADDPGDDRDDDEHDDGDGLDAQAGDDFAAGDEEEDVTEPDTPGDVGPDD